VDTPAGRFTISYELSDSIRLRSVELTGALAGALAPGVRARIAASLEGAHLDRGLLLSVLRRAFQENQVHIEGVSPDDVVRAVLDAEESTPAP
jgi:hypothetical protein